MLLQWTDEERMVLVKAASKVFPPGTQPDPNLGDRWGQISSYVQTHAHTSWKRGSKDVIAQVRPSPLCHLLSALVGGV